ncbi:MAG: hypothetical protein AAF388_08075 [Bacteroidota bacterium]
MKLIIFLLLTGAIHAEVFPQKTVENYIFFNRDRDRISEKSFLKAENVAGAQLKYTWKELEPQKDAYDFSKIEKDLAFLQQHGKKLFIQLQDVSFDTAILTIPNYLLEDPTYHGGVAIQYLTDDDDNIIRQDGYMVRRWDDAVQSRFYTLLKALGSQFDGRIAGINLPETAVGFGESGKLYPDGFTPEIYQKAILAQMEVLKASFSESTVIQYANFMPGEWLPWDDLGYLEGLYQLASEKNIGMGGPDIKIYKKAQMNHSYKFLKDYAEKISTGMAVQWGNYEEPNPKTGKRVTIEEIYLFGKKEIHLDLIFWCTQEPYYSKKLLPFLSSLSE